MKKLSLKTYSLYCIKEFRQQNTMKLENLLQECEEGNSRLTAPFLCWCYLSDKNIAESTLMKRYFDKFDSYLMKNKEQNLLMYLRLTNDLDFQKYYNSFLKENLKRDDNPEKDELREKIRVIKDKHNLTNYRICQIADINRGNFELFFSKNMNDRLSLEKCKKVLCALNLYEKELRCRKEDSSDSKTDVSTALIS
jgi:hypothetical protein